MVPWLLFGVLFLLKIVYIARLAHSPSNSDELLYFQMAEEIASGRLHDSVQYPPVFPAAIAPALWFPAPYPFAIALMALLSSALVIPVWSTAREVVGERHASVVALLSCLIPFHYTYPRVVMSENLYYPLLMLAVYLVIAARWDSPFRRDTLTGLVLAALYLTRYMTLVFLPAFAVAWVLRERERTGRWWDRDALLRGAALTAAFAAPVFLWALAEMSMGATLVGALGFGMGLSPGAAPAEAKTLSRLIAFGSVYAASWALWIAPALGVATLAAVRLVRRPVWDALDRLTALTIWMAGPLLIVAARHVWKVSYNWPTPIRILDRYCIYLVVLGLIVTYAVVLRAPRERPLKGTAHIWVTTLGPLIGVAVSMWIVFGWGFIPAPLSASPGIVAGDTYHVFMMGWWFWPVAAAGILLVGWLLWHRDAGTIIPFVASVALFFIIGAPPYFTQLAKVPQAQVHAEVIAPLIKSTYPDAERLSVGISPNAALSAGVTSRTLTRELRVRLEWMTGKTVRTYVTEPNGRGAAFTIGLADEYREGDPGRQTLYRVGTNEYVAVPP